MATKARRRPSWKKPRNRKPENRKPEAETRSVARAIADTAAQVAGSVREAVGGVVARVTG
ncbi:hypothetical protein [Methylobacterium sp. WSM2598]|uniref:hypothetical protein n=1 Tax=Methylobacterium sp. WSM2598 TaxID=398261 RepID=UPI000367CD70|nr:hypothetical protein [Methylobacterium sp. WSM2598]